MRHIPQLVGLMFRPSGSNHKEFEEYVMSAKESISEGFKKQYEYLMGSMQVTAHCAKVYAYKNWKKVKDWSDMDIVVYDNEGAKNAVHYYKYKERIRRIQRVDSKGSVYFENMLERMNARKKENQNPIKKVSDVVLDYSDGDFSVKINGKCHGWIYDESIIIFADYIEQQIKKQKNGKNTQNLESKGKKGV